MNKLLYKKLEDYMKSCAKESAHDCSHIYRVLNNCLKIAKEFKIVDYDVLITSALLHDIGRDGEKEKHNEIGAEMAENFLKSINFPEEKISLVYHAIINHNNGSYGKQKTLEAKILYDADKLDAVGVMGICRTLIGIGNYNNPMYVLKNGKIDMDENCETDTFVRYYLSHIQKNYDRFYTKTARDIAHSQKKFDVQFFNAFAEYINDNTSESDVLENYFD